MGGNVLSPSDVALNMGKHSAMFCKSTPMDEFEIQNVVQRFTSTAIRAEKAGFDGVEYMLLMFIC